MTIFLALYRGTTIGDAVLIAASADQTLVRTVADALASQIELADDQDEIAQTAAQARKKTLQIIAQPKGQAPGGSR